MKMASPPRADGEGASGPRTTSCMEDQAWMFGGFGQRTAVSKAYAVSATVDSLNLCDLWRYSFASGWTLVRSSPIRASRASWIACWWRSLCAWLQISVCKRDLPLFQGDSQFSNIFVGTEQRSPTAGILATTWYDPS